MTADQSTAIRVMREEIRKLQRIIEAHTDQYGNVLLWASYKVKMIAEQIANYQESIKALEQMYSESEVLL